MGLIVGCVVLASGGSRRFGENKLLYPFLRHPLILGALSAAPADMPRLAVTRYPQVASLAQAQGFETILHDSPDLAVSVGLAAERALAWDGAIFLVGDQPLIRRQTLLRMRGAFAQDPKRIVRAACDGVAGNPLLFPRDLATALCRLPPGQGGSSVAQRHSARWVLVEADAAELTDIDTPQDLDRLKGANRMFTPKMPPFEDAVCVATVYNAIDGPMIQDLLEGAGIPSLMRPKYGLDPLPVLAGSSVLGQEIYVDAAQAEEARQVIAAFTGGSFQPADGEESPQ